ncbi:MAG TPA: RNA polymerase sigma factor, partial [Acidobacteriota bacterium]|nr:RNA polymerase sigma factor [Acidobacteriota bacterium]
AYRARRKLDPSRPFYPWYYQILRRLCFNFVRDRRRHRQKLQEQQSWLVDGLSGRLPRPDREAVRGELRRKLEEAIDQLPPHEREVFVLKEFEDLRYKDIAQLAGIPMGTVMSRLYSARRRLANQLEEWR